MPYYDDEATDKAVGVHHRWCVANGYHYNQPNRYESERVGNIVVLRNCRGVLARYRVLEDGRVRRIKDQLEA